MPMFSEGSLLKWKPLMEITLPSIIKGDIKGVVRALALRFRTVVMDKFLFPAMGMPAVQFECKVLRNYLLPIVRQEYMILPELMNVDGYYLGSKGMNKSGYTEWQEAMQRGKTLTGPDCRKEDAYGRGVADGPVKVRMRRVLRKTKKTVCQFEFSGDLHWCKEKRCTDDSWYWPRHTSTNYTKEIQEDGHDCAQWFLATNAVLQAIFGGGAGIRTMLNLDEAEPNCFGTHKTTDIITRK